MSSRSKVIILHAYTCYIQIDVTNNITMPFRGW